MNIFRKIKGKFRKKKYGDLSDLNNISDKLHPIPEGKQIEPELQEQQDKIRMDNVKTKLDMILTDLDNLKTQNQMTNERLKNIEKNLADMKGIKYY